METENDVTKSKQFIRRLHISIAHPFSLSLSLSPQFYLIFFLSGLKIHFSCSRGKYSMIPTNTSKIHGIFANNIKIFDMAWFIHLLFISLLSSLSILFCMHYTHKNMTKKIRQKNIIHLVHGFGQVHLRI